MLDLSPLKGNAPKQPVSPANTPANINVPAEYQTLPTAAAGALQKEKRKIATEMSLLDVSKLINERLRNCQTAIWAYNKAVKADCPPEEIAMLAAKALSLAVSDEMIYTSLEKKYMGKYGIKVSSGNPYEIIKESV